MKTAKPYRKRNKIDYERDFDYLTPIYKNDYSKEEDPMMWELHEIRSRMAKEGIKSNEINMNAEKVLEKFDMKDLIIKETSLTNNKD